MKHGTHNFVLNNNECAYGYKAWNCSKCGLSYDFYRDNPIGFWSYKGSAWNSGEPPSCEEVVMQEALE